LLRRFFRAQDYWKRRFQLQDLDGLKDLPPVAKSHPMTTPAEVVERIAELALRHPPIDATGWKAQPVLPRAPR
jgi:hypothetical protein